MKGELGQWTVPQFVDVRSCIPHVQYRYHNGDEARRLGRICCVARRATRNVS